MRFLLEPVFLFSFALLLHTTDAKAAAKRSIDATVPQSNVADPVEIEGTDSVLMKFSSDNKFLVYTDSKNDIKSVELATKKINRLVDKTEDKPDSKRVYFSILPDASKVLFAKGRSSQSNSNLYLSNLDGSDRILISNRLKQTYFIDRKTIANGKIFFQERRDDSSMRLMSFDLNTRTSSEIKSNDNEIWDIDYYNLSQDGSKIAYFGKSRSGRTMLFAGKSDGSDIRPLLDANPEIVPAGIGREASYFTDQGESIRFSADGNFVFFLSYMASDRGLLPIVLNLRSVDLRNNQISTLSNPSTTPGVREYWISDKYNRVVYLLGVGTQLFELWSSDFTDDKAPVRMHDVLFDGAAGVMAGSVMRNPLSDKFYFLAELFSADPNAVKYSAFSCSADPDRTIRASKLADSLMSQENMGTPRWSRDFTHILVSSTPDDLSGSKLVAYQLSSTSEIQLNANIVGSRVGTFSPTGKNNVAFTATERKTLTDLFFVNLTTFERSQINQPLGNDEFVSVFSISDDESMAAYIVRNGPGAMLWVRELKK